MSDEQITRDDEEWRDVTPEMIGRPILPGYQVSNHGRLRSKRPSIKWGKDNPGWRVLKGTPHFRGTGQHSGYTRHILALSGGRSWTVLAHVLVAYVFVGPKPFPRAEVRHLDGKKKNNSPNNLKWGTAKENSDDTYRHGTRTRGEKVGAAVLTEHLIRDAMKRRQSKETVVSIAKQCGVGLRTMHSVFSGESWSHVTGIPKKPQKKS